MCSCPCWLHEGIICQQTAMCGLMNTPFPGDRHCCQHDTHQQLNEGICGIAHATVLHRLIMLLLGLLPTCPKHQDAASSALPGPGPGLSGLSPSALLCAVAAPPALCRDQGPPSAQAGCSTCWLDHSSLTRLTPVGGGHRAGSSDSKEGLNLVLQCAGRSCAGPDSLDTMQTPLHVVLSCASVQRGAGSPGGEQAAGQHQRVRHQGWHETHENPER